MSTHIFYSTPVDKNTEETHADLIWVLPSQINRVLKENTNVGVVISYPHGCSYPLIQASETKMAITEGAVAVALVLNARDIHDLNAVLPPAITVQQALDQETVFFLKTAETLNPTSAAVLAQLAGLVQADGLWLSSHQDYELISTYNLNIPIIGPGADITLLEKKMHYQPKGN